MPGRARLLVALLASTALVTAGAAQAENRVEAAARPWTIERTPNLVDAQIGVLSSVACTRGTCTAVGSSAVTPSDPTRALAERWNGKRWRIQRIPNPVSSSDELYGVSCISGRACLAVGDAFHTKGRHTNPLAERWNGRVWRVQSTPKLKTSAWLYGASCTSASACTAVGWYHDSAGSPRALVERWNGRTWRVQPVPRPARSTQLTAVSCSTARACAAVGNEIQPSGNARPFAELWNGKRWRVRSPSLPTGTPAGLFAAVSCTSPRACTATGSSFGSDSPTLAERWNGHGWRVQPTPNPANFSGSFGAVTLDGVSCTSAKACTASGDYSPGGAADYFVESWNGITWRLQDTPRPSDFAHGALLGISCIPARCTTVGAYTGQGPLQATLAIAN